MMRFTREADRLCECLSGVPDILGSDPSTANVILELQKWRQEDSKSKVILSYVITSIRAIGPVSKYNKIKMKYEVNIFKDFKDSSHSSSNSRMLT